MFYNEDFLRKIVLHLNNPEDPSLSDEINRLRQESVSNEKFYQEIYRICKLSAEVGDMESIDIHEAARKLSERIDPDKIYKTQRRFSAIYYLKRIAAAFIIALASYFIYSLVFLETYITKRVAGNTIDSVLLEDGSQIYLAANSVLKYPEKRKGKERKVYLLDGEAFFKVAKDPEHPFSVEIGNSKVTVLGTSFNIKKNENNIDLSVNTGQVLLELPSGNKKSILTAGQGVAFDISTEMVQPYSSANSNNNFWISRELQFSDASLAEVFGSLEKCYGVKFILKGSFSNYNKFNGTIKDKSLEQVLSILKEMHPIKIENRDSVLVISKK